MNESAAVILAASQEPTATSATPEFSVPLADLPEFTALAAPRRTEVQAALAVLRRVHELRGAGASLERACVTVAATSRHLLRGCSKSSLRRKYELYQGAGGDWRTLIKGYKGPHQQPAEFTQHVKRVAEENHRSQAEAFHQLRAQWQAGHPIPGYGTWVEYYLSQYPDRPLPRSCPRGFFPAGWSTGNLYRYAPSKGARVLFQRGLAAAKKHFPSVKRDPSGLRPMEWIVIDDFELDCLCVFPGSAEHKPQIGRVAGILAMCVGTRKKLAWGLGQRMERHETAPDGTVRTVRTGIARIDVQLFLQGLFAEHGLPDYPVTLLVENAAAAISPELELALTTLFEGRVRIERTGLIDHKTLTNGFVERGGKPWEKGWIESLFNSLWNTLGNIPGYKGSNQRLNGPADLDAKIAYTKLLLGQGERALNLPPEKIALLRLPFPSLEGAMQAFAWAVAQSDQRTAHKYVGFDRVTEFLLEEGGEPQPLQALALLPPERQTQVQAVERMEAPAERWARLRQGVDFRPVPPAVLALLLLTPKRVTYRNHAISFVHDRTGYSYIDPQGDTLRDVADGAEFLAYFDPRHPEQLHLATLKGAYVGTLPRLGGRRGAVDLRDKAALAEAGAQTATIVNRTMGELRERHAAADAQAAQDRAHNNAIVAEHREATAGLTGAEKIAAAAGAAAGRQARCKALEKAVQRQAAKITDADVSDFLTPEAATPAAPITPAAEDLGDYL